MAITERKGLTTMAGKPLILVGNPVKVGDVAPDFTVVDRDWTKVKFSDFRQKVRLISAVPSLDTGVCAAQTKRFNDEAAKLPKEVAVITVSQDLPFAQKRFCEAENVATIPVLSDHVWREFGMNYGVLIKDMALLARSIFVVGRDGRISYMEIVPEVTNHPNYERALAAVGEALGR